MKASMRDSNGSVSFLIPQPFGLPKTDEFVRGGTAAFVNILCNAKICGDNGLGTFPINKVMFRQQLTGNGMLSVGKALYHEGFRLLLAFLLADMQVPWSRRSNHAEDAEHFVNVWNV